MYRLRVAQFDAESEQSPEIVGAVPHSPKYLISVAFDREGEYGG
jgi:hypothetical protein